MDGFWKSALIGPTAALALGATCSLALGQDAPTPAGDPTQLPEIVVEAPEPTAEPTAQPIAPQPGPVAPSPYEGQGGDVFQSVLSNTIFDPVPTDGYVAESATTGTLLNIPQVDSPVTVNVVTRDTLRDQQVLNFRDLVRDVPSAVVVGDAQFPDRIFLRGLQVNSMDYRKNGFVDPTYTPRGFQNIDRVEILKGPASVIYGSGSASGTVNFITKKPLDAEFATGGYQFGSFGLSRFTGDVNGYVNQDGTILYRLNIADETGNSYRDFGFQDRHQIAPVVTFLLGEDTILTWDSEYTSNRRRGDLGIPVLGGNALAVQPNKFYGLASDNVVSDDYRTSLLLTHEINDVWTANIGASTIQYRFDGQSTGYTTPLVVAPGLQYDRTTTTYRDHESASSIIANVTADRDGPLFNHKFVAGTEHIYYDTNSTFSLDTFSADGGGFLPPIGTYTFGAPVFRQIRHGYYLQDYTTINDHWAVLSGVRFDTFELQYERNNSFGGMLLSEADTTQTWSRTSPRVGLVYHPIADTNWSFYGNYSQSFSPPGGGAFPGNGAPVRPESGENYEAGSRAELLPGLIWDISAFHVTRANVPQPVGINYIQAGEYRGQGVETSLTGQLTDRWSMIANAAYTDTRLTDDANPAFFGQRNRNVPLQSGSIWSRYNLIDDEYRTLGLAMGVVYIGERAGDIANTVFLPSYSRYDMGVYYTRGRINSSVYVENLFDRNYALGSIESTGLAGTPSVVNVTPGAPVNARANIWFTF